MAKENQEMELSHEDDKNPNQLHGGVEEAETAGASRAGSWPEVVGFTAEEAEKRIKQEMPHVRFQVVGPDQFVTMDFNRNRVRIFVDSSGKVARAPIIG